MVSVELLKGSQSDGPCMEKMVCCAEDSQSSSNRKPTLIGTEMVDLPFWFMSPKYMLVDLPCLEFLGDKAMVQQGGCFPCRLCLIPSIPSASLSTIRSNT